MYTQHKRHTIYSINGIQYAYTGIMPPVDVEVHELHGTIVQCHELCCARHMMT